MLLSRETFFEIIRFGIVGVIATALHYGIYWLLQSVIDVNVAYTIGYFLSFVVNYLLSAKFTFRKKKSVKNGFGFGGLSLFMMQQVAPGKHQMAHYAFASGIMNFGVMIPGMLSGWVCESLGTWFDKPGGYEPFFIFVLIATIPAFLITYFLPFKYDNGGNLIEGEKEYV